MIRKFTSKGYNEWKEYKDTGKFVVDRIYRVGSKSNPKCTFGYGSFEKISLDGLRNSKCHLNWTIKWKGGVPNELGGNWTDTLHDDYALYELNLNDLHKLEKSATFMANQVMEKKSKFKHPELFVTRGIPTYMKEMVRIKNRFAISDLIDQMFNETD